MRKNGIRLIIGLALSLFFVLADGMGWIKPIYSATNYIFEPIQYWVGRTSVGFSNTFSTIFEISGLRKENSDLRIENAKLTAEIGNLGDVQAENETLRTQLGVEASKNWNLQMVRVLSVDRSGQSEHIIIDGGEDQGIIAGQSVIIGNLLVGQVRDVYKTTSRVRLVTNQQSNVMAMDQNTSAKGLVHGSLEGVVMEEILENESVNVGDVIVCWSSEIPEGLVIGEIRQVEDQPTASTRKVYIETGLNLEDLNYVFVITNE